jgi:heptosyltransferase I
MKSILLVKTSSLGDVVHNLPVASDIHAAFPDARIDWVVEEDFAVIPGLHGAVREVIPAAVRRWRSRWWQRGTRAEISAFLRRLRARTYDAVIDTQGLLKSALIARAARGTRFGLDWKSSREPLSLFFDRTFGVARTLHAVERNRTLAAEALEYGMGAGVDYGLRAPAVESAWRPPRHYAVLLHATSAAAKLWPEACWGELGEYFQRRGICPVLPWGSAAERDRSERIAARLPGATVPPALRLDEAAALLARAQAVIGVDTGLTHLAAALGAPTIGIYCATDPAATGIYGCARARNVGGMGQVPSIDEATAALDSLFGAQSSPAACGRGC